MYNKVLCIILGSEYQFVLLLIATASIRKECSIFPDSKGIPILKFLLILRVSAPTNCRFSDGLVCPIKVRLSQEFQTKSKKTHEIIEVAAIKLFVY